jgi:hypothetical protein
MLMGYVVHSEEEDEEDFMGRHTKRVMNSMVSPVCAEPIPSWESSMFMSSSEELYPMRVHGSKTLAHIKGVFGKFALFTVSSLEESTE